MSQICDRCHQCVSTHKPYEEKVTSDNRICDHCGCKTLCVSHQRNQASWEERINYMKNLSNSDFATISKNSSSTSIFGEYGNFCYICSTERIDPDWKAITFKIRTCDPEYTGQHA